jgi:DNA replicative helicase MCM subunit Mcm2 (Cdc46/Mcm family)
MPHLGHGTHLCHLVEYEGIDIKSYKPLVKNAKFLCKKCGRVAAKEENLCEPIEL